MNTSATDSIKASGNTSAGAMPLAGAGLALVLLSPGLMTVSRVNLSEAVSGLFLAVLLAAILLAFKGFRGLAASVAGTGALAALTCVSVLHFSPLSLRAVLQQNAKGLQWTPLLLAAIPALILAVLPIAGLRTAQDYGPLGNLSARINAWLLGCVALAGGLMLAGYSMANITALAALLAVAVLVSKPLWLLVSYSSAAKILSAGLALVFLANAVSGLLAYGDLRGALARADAEKTAKRLDQANAALDEANRINERVQSRSLKIEIEKRFGALRELQNDMSGAMHHWNQVAQLQGVEFASHPAARRILVRNGDSLLGWRQLVQQGFSAVLNDETVDSQLALGDKPDSDARASLLAALLAWEKNEGEAERRARLERLIAKRPNDVTGNTLLNVLGRPLPKEPLWAGADLIVGEKASRGSVNGTIEDLGRVETIVFLTEGQWECRVRARGTPLNEEWPILRVEIDGVEALRARVDKAEFIDLPFTFTVKNRNLFRVRFVFENQLRLFQGSQQSHRGLVVDGVYFQRGSK
jgi:hypothetical protein